MHSPDLQGMLQLHTGQMMKRTDPDLNTDAGAAILKIAVTGTAGSGKTAVCNRIEALGAEVVNSDELAREVVVPGTAAYEKIVDYFGKKTVSGNGTLNRQMLRHIIINDDASRRALEQIVHPEIKMRIDSRIARAGRKGKPIIVVEVPLLFESGMAKQFDIIILVVTDDELKIERLIQRDRVSKDDAEALLKSQLSDKKKVEKSDFLIHNDDDLQEMEKDVDRIYKKILEKIKKNSENA
jgi:dephospho-CoA kinase